MICRVASLALFALLLSLPARAAGPDLPERLVYDLNWSFIKAGTLTQQITREGDRVSITSVARSNTWLSHFFPVDDHVESILEDGTALRPGLPVHYRMRIREGSHRRDREIIFFQGAGRAEYIDHLSGEKATVDIPRETYDTTSCFYYIRSLPLEVGQKVFVDVLDNKRVRRMEATVLRREKMKTVLGKVDTVVVRNLDVSEGMLHKSGPIDIWLTDDKRHIPVRIKTKIAVGSITATLAGVNPILRSFTKIFTSANRYNIIYLFAERCPSG